MSHNISPSLTYFTPYDNLMDVPACMLSHFSRVQLFVTLSTVARQAPPSVGFSRQESWSGLPRPSPGDLPNPGTEPASLALAGGLFTTGTAWQLSQASGQCTRRGDGDRQEILILSKCLLHVAVI